MADIDGDRLEALIAAAVAEAGESVIVTGWVVLASYQTAEMAGENCGYWRDSARGQGFHSTLGLVALEHGRLLHLSGGEDDR